MSQVESNETHLKILCFDGGGVRGLTSLLILRGIMNELIRSSSNSQDALRPCHVFDMICGTSTGGLIALMLGRLRMSVDEAITQYLHFSKTVFEKKKPMLWLPWGKRSIYDTSKLEKWVIDLVQQYGKGETSLADPLGASCCRTFVLAATQDSVDSHPKHFRSYSTKSHPADTCTIWEAARATTAAFPFFSPAEVGSPSEKFIDGKFSGSNNPSMRAIDEVAREFPSRKIVCFLSLGTGVPDAISAAGGPKQVAKACMKLIESCEIIHDEVGRAFDNDRVAAVGEPYFRFSAERGQGNIELDEWNRLDTLTGITDTYMQEYERETMVQKCLKTLMPGPQGIVMEYEITSTQDMTLTHDPLM